MQGCYCLIIMLGTETCELLHMITFPNYGGMATMIFTCSYCSSDGEVLVKTGSLGY